MKKPTVKAKPASRGATKRAAKAPLVSHATPEQPAKPQGPTVGRIVHYYDHDLPTFPGMDVEHGPFAAIVSLVRPAVEADEAEGINASDEAVDLYVFVPGMNGQLRGNVAYAHRPIEHEKTQAHNRRYWTWPIF